MIKKKHKWKYQINVKKKVLVLVILGVSLFVFLGYARLESNFNIFGTLEVAKYDKTLYGVMEKDASKNIASTYSGPHIDNVEELGNEAIYYYNDETDPNNLIFAGTCFKMIRTTDIGGIKLLYNGEPENGKCLDTRGTHIGYYGYPAIYLTENYWFGTSYTYDNDTGVFSLSGTKEQKRWMDGDYDSFYGKYTCRSTSEDATCSTLYLVRDYYSGNRAYALQVSYNSGYIYYGRAPFNREADSPAYFGYMYGDVRTVQNTSLSSSQWYRHSNDTLNSITLGTTYYYASSMDYGQTTANRYTLINPTQIDATTDYSTLVGKYVMRNVTSGNSVYYVVAMDGTTAYARYLENGDTNLIMNVADSVTRNPDGTYTLDNYSPVSYSDWYSNYTNYNFKYTCNDNSTTCLDPFYIYDVNPTYYRYVSGILTISETRNGLELVNPVTIPAGEWYKGNNTTYKDYKYICGNNSSICDASDLRYITARDIYNYTYIKNHYFGTSVKYENGEYTLQNPIEVEDFVDLSNLNTHHYMCTEIGKKVCTTAAYNFYIPALSDIRYLQLDGEMDTPEELLESMLEKNDHDSVIKSGLEGWYKQYINYYDDMIEDAIYCNNRSYDTTEGYTFNESAWNDNGTSTTGYLYFKDRNITDLSCAKEKDRFSVANGKAKTNYKVGLLTVSEANLMGSLRTTIGGNGFHLMSAREFDTATFTGRVYYLGNTSGGFAYNNEGVRPSITLKEGTEYLSGTGTKDDPYIAKVEGWSLQSSMFPIKDQQWMYLENGKKLSDGWHQLNDTHGDPNMYYFENGYSHHGWLELDNNKYYLSTFDDDDNGIIDGRRITNETREIDGVNYTFDENGVCTNCE